MELVLASGSPRRKELLESLGFTFRQVMLSFEETIPSGIFNNDAAKFLAIEKNIFYRSHFPNDIVLTADTMVLLGDKILGKAPGRSLAIEMLRLLSGNTHLVITGCCISSREKTIDWQDETLVTFRELRLEEIESYIDRFQPYDRAGAYGIQDWVGMIGIEQIQGSFYNVMGLPTNSVYRVLTQEFGVFPSYS